MDNSKSNLGASCCVSVEIFPGHDQTLVFLDFSFGRAVATEEDKITVKAGGFDKVMAGLFE